ncbi:MAG TPA: hypothetical protein VIN08_27645 [Ohtaekwangia sp.]|uniref:hypothetical protein n=1 Tax=Ohtaekwangia sp. TaxID=2066019 RepID=UPI002F9355A7
MQDKHFKYIDLVICVPFIIAPLFLSLPYRVNIFLSWEGAYRLSIGQVPYEDFGLPMGICYWLIPALFFKIFGPTFLSLVKAQVFINLISILSLRGILYNLKVKPYTITLSILVFCLTYVLYNFWPWYNHSVVVYELVALFFLTKSFTVEKTSSKTIWLALAALFSAVTFFTKQDVGAIGILLSLFLLVYRALLDKERLPVITYLGAVVVIGIVSALPFLQYDFLYWFNYGQPPHSSRLDIVLLLNTFLEGSIVEKTYIALIFILLLCSFKTIKEFIEDRNQFTLAAISVCMIAQAIVTKMTSPLPTDHMTYYHVFGFACILNFFPWQRWDTFVKPAIAILLLVLLIYSAGYWKYVSDILHIHSKKQPMAITNAPKPALWKGSSAYPTLKHVTLPESTIAGIDSIAKLPFIHNKGLKVLNMSEITFLAKEFGYTPLTQHPLWFHVNIGMFQKQIDEINERVKNHYYDLVLFEDIPSLTEFYPYQVREALRKYYIPNNKFLAPRKLEDSSIEVFINPDLAKQYLSQSESDPTK